MAHNYPKYGFQSLKYKGGNDVITLHCLLVLLRVWIHTGDLLNLKKTNKRKEKKGKEKEEAWHQGSATTRHLLDRLLDAGLLLL